MSTILYTVSCAASHFQSFHLPNPIGEWDRPSENQAWLYFNYHTDMTPDRFFEQLFKSLLCRDLTTACSLLGKLPGVECEQTTPLSVTFQGGKGSVEVSRTEDDMLRVSSVLGSNTFDTDEEDLVVYEIFRSLMALS